MVQVERNVNGHIVVLDHCKVRLDDIEPDSTNPRIAYFTQQLPFGDRNNKEALLMLLCTQESVDTLKKSILATGGIQEPIFIGANRKIREGNRRYAALVELSQEYPSDQRFTDLPAYIIPDGTPEHVVKKLVNSMHLNPKRTWAPFERATEMRALLATGETLDEIAAQYELSPESVRDFIEAADLMVAQLMPLYSEPGEPEFREKFSYFLEYVKGPRKVGKPLYSDIDTRFAVWVKDEIIPKAEKVRRLAKILVNPIAVEMLEAEGFDAAMDVILDDICLNPQYRAIDKAVMVLKKLSPDDLLDLRNNLEKQTIIKELVKATNAVTRIVGIAI